MEGRPPAETAPTALPVSSRLVSQRGGRGLGLGGSRKLARRGSKPFWGTLTFQTEALQMANKRTTDGSTSLVIIRKMQIKATRIFPDAHPGAAGITKPDDPRCRQSERSLAVGP